MLGLLVFGMVIIVGGVSLTWGLLMKVMGWIL